MNPDQQRHYNAIFPRLAELSEKQELGTLTPAEDLEYQRLSAELESLMDAMAPYPPIIQN